MAKVQGQSIYQHVESSTLNRQGEDNRIQLNSASIEILVHMIGHKELSIDSVTKSLWNGNGDGDESDIARLRMRLKRLNSLIETHWGLRGFAKIKDSKLILNGSVQKRPVFC